LLNRLNKTAATALLRHRSIDIDGIGFYREAGPENALMVLLPHGLSSSFAFRHFMPSLADRRRLIMPHFQASAITIHQTASRIPMAMRTTLERLHTGRSGASLSASFIGGFLKPAT
jgi:hypothetical protein